MSKIVALRCRIRGTRRHANTWVVNIDDQPVAAIILMKTKWKTSWQDHYLNQETLDWFSQTYDLPAMTFTRVMTAENRKALDRVLWQTRLAIQRAISQRQASLVELETE